MNDKFNSIKKQNIIRTYNAIFFEIKYDCIKILKYDNIGKILIIIDDSHIKIKEELLETLNVLLQILENDYFYQFSSLDTKNFNFKSSDILKSVIANKFHEDLKSWNYDIELILIYYFAPKMSQKNYIIKRHIIKKTNKYK